MPTAVMLTSLPSQGFELGFVLGFVFCSGSSAMMSRHAWTASRSQDTMQPLLRLPGGRLMNMRKMAATIRKELARDVEHWMCCFMSPVTAPNSVQYQWPAGAGFLVLRFLFFIHEVQ